ncbi:BlaI family transcriptional regulator [Thalassotalea insulae]|uniref:BlaI family transcriptional regulator n=1 Tax=Thalassotalea insulae TaxID=2056778 RepID=A0ABQ6GWD8_9GAMM|nr:BlaI/MecI/CopY family transcriptional regulator [Thalassotalea insulae]GLX79687.1 BlaI family transcriptional regulator [Thalassotalea insulae]
MAEISQTEFEVLDVLWQQYPASANEIIERLNQQKDWHEKTVKTLLNRLVKKGAISFEKQQRRYLYTPLLAREAYVTSQSESLIERLFSGRVSPLIAGFAKNKHLEKDDIEELKSIIASWEQEHDPSVEQPEKKSK